METITTQVTAGDKALILAGRLHKAGEELTAIKEQFPSRKECETYIEHGIGTCRDTEGVKPADYCERCQVTEELATEWSKAKQDHYRIRKQLEALGKKYQEGNC